MAKGKSRRPPKKTSPVVSYAVERAMARSAGKDPEAVSMPAGLGRAPAGMSMDAASPEVIERARREGAEAERARVAAARDGRRKKAGRPTKYTPEIATKICALIAEARPLVEVLEIIEADGGPYINSSSVWRWLDKYEDFRSNYARARAEQAEVDADAIRSIVKRAVDPLTPEDMRLKADVARVAIDAHKWLAGKRKPKVYGDKIELSADKDNPPFAGIEVYVVDPQKAYAD